MENKKSLKWKVFTDDNFAKLQLFFSKDKKRRQISRLFFVLSRRIVLEKNKKNCPKGQVLLTDIKD